MAKRGRNDPYKAFNFQVAFGAALAAIAGFALVKKLRSLIAAKHLNPNDYVEDVPATGRPMEGVGTTVSPLPPDPPPPPPPPKPAKKRRSSKLAARQPRGDRATRR
jgi:hypothetical protein